EERPFFSLSAGRVRVGARVLLGVFLALLIAFFFFQESLRNSGSTLVRRLASASLTERTVKTRVISWQMAWEGIKERPFLGWGPENFILLSNKHYDPRLYDQEAWFDRAHNLVFDFTAAQGVVGLALLLYLMWLLSVDVLRVNSERSWYEKAAMLAAGAAYLVNDMFVFDNAATLIPLSLAVAYLSKNADRNPHNPKLDRLKPKTHPAVFYLTLALSCAFFIFVFWGVSFIPARNNFRAHAAWKELYSAPDKAAAVARYEAVTANGRYLNLELNRALADFVIDFKKEGVSYGPAVDKKIFDTAIMLVGMNMKMDPHNVRWYVYQGNFYNLARALDPTYSAKAEEIFTKALTLSPTRQQIYFDLAQAQFDQGKIDEAFRNIDAGIGLEPSYLAGYRHKAAFLILSGRNGAEDLINFLRNDFERRDESFAEYWDIFADAYFKAKKFNQAAELYQETITYYERQTHPGRRLSSKALAERYARMAALWAMGGEREKSYQAALKVVEYDPSRRGEAAVFLKSIGRKLP
ncbi:MAG: O-antigen ligase family protein, partial [Patescibacteria group bacterium]